MSAGVRRREASVITKKCGPGRPGRALPRSGRQLTLGRGAEPGNDADAAKPGAGQRRLLLDQRGAVGADVLKQANGDLAVSALRPAADDPAVQPDGRTGIAVGVEERLPVRPEEPGPI